MLRLLLMVYGVVVRTRGQPPTMLAQTRYAPGCAPIIASNHVTFVDVFPFLAICPVGWSRTWSCGVALSRRSEPPSQDFS